jgi:thiamine biosynthesis lipoprotein
MKIPIALILSWVLLVLGGGCGSRDEHNSFTTTDEVMGTTLHLALHSETMTKTELAEAAADALSEVRQVETLMSSWVADSDVNRINEAGKNSWVTVDPLTFTVIEQALDASRTTNGGFEATVSPLVDLWGFGARSEGPPSIPPEEAIAAALSKVGHSKVVLDPERSAVATTEDGVTIDLAGIAKGYGVDMAISVLRARGVEHAIVEIGGEVGVIGMNREGEKWRIGVNHPLQQGRFLTVLELEDENVATSGDYQRYFVVDGVRYSHIIDPRTGWPATSNIASVTIVATSCAKADALATGLSVLSYEEGGEILERLPGVEGIIVRRAAERSIDVFVSSGLKDKIKLLEH